MRFLKFISPAVVLSIILATPAFAAELELKFGHVGKPGSLFEASVNEFAKRANAKLGGKAKVVAFGSSQLGKDKELLKKLKLGTVNFSLPSSVMASVSDEFGLFDMPYLVKDRAHMARIEKKSCGRPWHLFSKAKATKYWRSGRTASAILPTTSGPSTHPKTCRALN